VGSSISFVFLPIGEGLAAGLWILVILTAHVSHSF
jgi:hypothetical protein